MSGPRILLLDCETRPHEVFTWGLFNQFVAINQIARPGSTICFAAQWLGGKKVMFHKGKGLVKAAHNLLEQADIVVTFNGKKFDLPVLNREFILAGLKPPSTYKQVDLYQTVRRNFKWASNKLDFICQQLKIGSKTQHKGFDLWLGCINGDERSWRIMEKYNIQDVKLLAKLYSVLLPWVKHPNLAFYSDSEDLICPNCESKHVQKRGAYITGAAKYQRYNCQDCGTWFRGAKRIKTDVETRVL